MPYKRGSRLDPYWPKLFRIVFVLLLGGLGPDTVALARDKAIPSFKQVDSIESRVQAGAAGQGQSRQGTANGYFPRIAREPARYLSNQRIAFRDGTRQRPPMRYPEASQPNPCLRETAEHFAKNSGRPSRQGSHCRPKLR